MADPIQDATTTPNPAPRPSRPNGASSGGPQTAPALDRGPTTNNEPRKPGVVQPKPQALPKRAAGSSSSIIVSPRQKGNPILNCIKSMPWEYGDIPADYVLGATTCALFLSLKYHRLHPEYVYTRIRNLQGKYNLRIVLCMVDIPNHEESLKELSKTSLINNVTLVLCWSAAEGGRYLELFKTYENAAPTAIKQHQSTAYSDRMVDFITTPRSINKTDAVALVSQFGTVRTAVNARHEDVATIAGWGEKKVQRWCAAVREPFRSQRATKRGGGDVHSVLPIPDAAREETRTVPVAASASGASGSVVPLREASGQAAAVAGLHNVSAAPARARPAAEEALDDEEAVLAESIGAEPASNPAKKRKTADDDLDEGVMAALSKLRKAD